MSLTLAPASMLADEVRGSNKKARSLSAWVRQAIRAVSLSDKATGVSAANTRAGHHFNASVWADTSKLAYPLSSRSRGRSRHVADNEHSPFRPTGSYHRGSYPRLFDSFDRKAARRTPRLD